jgi:hypothetical protein
VRLANVGDGCGTLSSNGYTVSVLAPPNVTHTSGDPEQTVLKKGTISPIVYTAPTGATPKITGTLPAGASTVVSGTQLTIQGSPTANEGTYGFTVSAVNSIGCPSTIDPAVSLNVVLYAPASPNTWTGSNNKIWSDVIISLSECATSNPLFNYDTRELMYCYTTQKGQPLSYVSYYNGYTLAQLNTANKLCLSGWSPAPYTDVNSLSTSYVQSYGYYDDELLQDVKALYLLSDGMFYAYSYHYAWTSIGGAVPIPYGAPIRCVKTP